MRRLKLILLFRSVPYDDIKLRELLERVRPPRPLHTIRFWRPRSRQSRGSKNVAEDRRNEAIAEATFVGLNARHDRGDSCCGASLVNYSMSLSDSVGCALGWGCEDVPVGAPAFAYSYPAKSSEPTTEPTISAAHPATPNPRRTNPPIPSHFPAIAL
jgi:hypothetical protein